jgi:hypothetical protein
MQVPKVIIFYAGIFVLTFWAYPSVADDQQYALPFEMVAPRNSTLLQQWLTPLADTIVPSNDGGWDYETVGPKAEFEYVVSNETISKLILDEYQHYLETQGFKLVSTNIKTMHSVCPTYVGDSNRGDIQGNCDMKWFPMRNLIREEHEGYSLVEMAADTIGDAADSTCEFRSDQEHAAVPGRQLSPGENLLWICVAWPGHPEPVQLENQHFQ